jgi:hypothetical protein
MRISSILLSVIGLSLVACTSAETPAKPAVAPTPTTPAPAPVTAAVATAAPAAAPQAPAPTPALPGQRALDLRSAMNRGWKDEVAGDGKGGWTDQGQNDLSGMNAAPQRIAGIDFALVDPASNQDRGVIAIANRQGFVREADIVVGGQCPKLALLHTAAWLRSGAAVGTVAWRYTDGSSADATLSGGTEVGDWWKGLARGAQRLELKDANPWASPVYLFATLLTNPHPEKPVASLHLSSAKDGKAIWLVLAATVAPAEAVIASGGPAGPDLATWAPFSPRTAPAAKPLLDLSSLLDAPAGKHGFLRREGAHFVFADGTSARFFGTNIHSASGSIPEHADAERLAATLAGYGVNLVRLHLPETVLIDNTRNDRQQFVGPETWDRFDYLVKCLYDRGIHILLDSVTGLSSRDLQPADGVLPGYGNHRPWAYFIPRLEEMARAYAKGLLLHRNTYTGRTYAADPGIAMMLLINEQTMFFDWVGENGTAMPDAYRQELEHRFGEFLQRSVGDRAALAAAWGDELTAHEDPATGTVALAALPRLGANSGHRGKPGDKRYAATVAFLTALQTAHDEGMRSYLRELGVQVPICGSNIIETPADLRAAAVHDMTAHNAYYDHTQYRNGQKLQSSENVPMALLDWRRQGDRSIEMRLAAARQAGLPLISTESDIMWPHEWRSTYGLSLAATAGLQDWDAVFQYAFAGGWGYSLAKCAAATGVLQSTVEGNDPAVAGLFPAMALMLVRRDISPAKPEVQMVYSAEAGGRVDNFTQFNGQPFSYLANVCQVSSAFGTPVGTPAATIGGGSNPLSFAREDSVSAQVRKLDAELKQRGVVPSDRGLQGDRLISVTGELTRDWGRGLVLVDSPRTQGLSGFPGEGVRLRDCTISCPESFATVITSVLEGTDVGHARRLLLTAVGRANNSAEPISYGARVTAPNGMVFGEDLELTRNSAGPGEVRIEPLPLRVHLPYSAARVTALAADRSAAGPAMQCARDGDGIVVDVTKLPPSVWYVIETGTP